MPTVRVTRNAQVTLPRGVREKLGIKIGDRIAVRVEGETIVMEKISENVWENCTGFLPENFDEVLRETRGDLRKRFRRLGCYEDLHRYLSGR